MRYFLGVDVGGTKTHALITAEDGSTVGFGETGAGNHETVGYDGLRKALLESTSLAFKAAGLSAMDISAAGFGVAGYDWPSERQETLDAISSLGLTCPIELVNDTVVGLLAGSEKGWGVAVDAGTGDNCWGRDRTGKEAHMTGCGPLFAEFGGAGSLVMRAVQQVSLEWGQRGPKTRLSQEFMKIAAVASMDELLDGLSQMKFSFDAGLAPLIFRVAEEGDAVARETIAWAGTELGSMVNGIVRQLKFETLDFDVVMLGSMFKGGTLLTEPFKNTVLRLAPKANFILLDVPPVIGGVILAMKQAGVQINDQIWHKIRQTISTQ